MTFIYTQGLVVRLEAVDAVNNTVSCAVSGSGSVSNPYVVEARVNSVTDIATQNACGMFTVGQQAGSVVKTFFVDIIGITIVFLRSATSG